MAWNTLTYSCGHTAEVQLYGKRSERERKVASAAKYPCAACRAAAAQVKDTANGLPQLIGSEKQIAWASECRAKMLPLADQVVAKVAEILAKLEQMEPNEKAPLEKINAEIIKMQVIITKAKNMKTITKAEFWIENRSASFNDLIANLT